MADVVGNGISLGNECEFTCRKGHVFSSPVGPLLSIALPIAGVVPGGSIPETVSSGPLCPYCVVEFLRESCGASPVKAGGAG